MLVPRAGAARTVPPQLLSYTGTERAAAARPAPRSDSARTRVARLGRLHGDKRFRRDGARDRAWVLCPVPVPTSPRRS